jgi:quinol-cytochrome oxidoreductase complex cytochrome b subunit
VNANALLRFYVLHTMILPLTLMSLVAVHLWRLHKDGGMYDLDAKGNRIANGHGENGVSVDHGAPEITLSYGDLLFREIIAIEALAVVLFTIALIWAAPLEQLANPMHTPNPAKAPWYFTGLQELLHYFPPFVAGIILPVLIISGLIFIPFFTFFDETETQDALRWLRRKSVRMAIVAMVLLLLSALLIHLHAWDTLPPLAIAVLLVLFAARGTGEGARGLRGWLRAQSLAFWIMTLFLMEAVVLTAVGTFFRGPGWSWVWPWRG